MRLDALPAVLTVREVAAVLRLSIHSVRGLIREGRLSVIRAGRAIRVPRAAVLALLGEEETPVAMNDGGRDLKELSHDEAYHATRP